MMRPDTPVEVWAKRYGLELSPRSCTNCGIDLHPTVPLATPDWRGVMSEPHPCGERFTLIRVVPANPEERQQLRQLFSDLVEHKEGT